MKIYDSDNWFYRMGVIGFHRIIEFNSEKYNIDLSKYNYRLLDDGIEFDCELLEDFPKYYFQYFYNEYNIAESIKYKFDYFFKLASKKDSFNTAKIEIKKIIKDRNSKIKKMSLDNCEKFETVEEVISNLNYEDLDKMKILLDKYIELFKEDKINVPQTLNFFKFVLQNNFYGQDSFLNVCNSKKTIEEQKKIMFKDFVKPVIQIDKLGSFINNNDMKILEQYINENIDNSKEATEIDKYMKNLNKKMFSKKVKYDSIDEFNKVYDKCSFCDSYMSYGSNYNDGSFLPLAISSSNANLFWNMNAKFPICPLCKLILVCTAAGTTRVYKNYLGSNYDFNDKLYYGFISIEGSLKELIKENNTFKNLSSKDISFEEWLYDSLKQEKQISYWQLQNILYVEFNADYRSKNSKLNYYNIPNYLALFLNEQFNMIESIKSAVERVKVFDWILSRKDLKHLIDSEIRKKIKGQYVEVNILNLIKIKNKLDEYKQKGRCKKVNNESLKNIDWIYREGFALSQYYYSEEMKNKLPGISYKLLNAIKAGNKKDFMDSILRVYMSASRQVPKVILQAIKEETLSFSQVGHSFLAGLNGYYEKDEKEGAN